MKIFISGADGFIGSHVTEAMVKIGHEVTALSQYNSFNNRGWLDELPDDILSGLKILTGDLRDRSQVINYTRKMDAVIHLGALIAIPYSYIAPQSYLDTNVYGTLNILDAVMQNGIGKLIHTSTSEVYGSAKFIPITEQHPLVGQSPYAASKIAADQLVFSFYSSFQCPAVTLRPFNTYGPRQSQRAVIPTIIEQLLRRPDTLTLGAISPTRDFNFIDDTVMGFVKALECDDCNGMTINLGSGFEVSVGDTAKIISELMGVPVSVETSEERLRPKNSEVDRLFACNKLACDKLGWVPKYSGIDGFKLGLEKTIEWFSARHDARANKSEKYTV